MNCTLKTQTLQDILDLCVRFASKHATLPILENVYLQAELDQLILKATDMEKHIEVSIPADIKNDGALTVNAKTMFTILKTIEESQVQLIVNDTTLTIKTTQDTFDIKGIAATEYVALPEIDNNNSVQTDITTLTTGLNKVSYTVSEKNFSPIMTGVYIHTKTQNNQKHMVFVGTDSFRLAEYKIPVSNDSHDMQLVMPKTNTSDIEKVLDYYAANQGEQTTISFSDNLVKMTCKTDKLDITMTSLLINGNFPDYNHPDIMPTEFQTTILADREQLEKAIKKATIMTRDINNYILLETKDNHLTISSGETDKGAATTSIPVIVTGQDMTVGINGKYISDFIRAMQGNEIAINIADTTKPLVFKDQDDKAYTYIARPLLK